MIDGIIPLKTTSDNSEEMLFKIFYPVFVQWANQMAFEVSGGKYGKNNTYTQRKHMGSVCYSQCCISKTINHPI